jgi:hypothetical protein
LLADLPVGRDVVRIADLKFVDLRFGDELLDLDGSLTFKHNGLKLLGIKLSPLAIS